jgi:hypothetical protein
MGNLKEKDLNLKRVKELNKELSQWLKAVDVKFPLKKSTK